MDENVPLLHSEIVDDRKVSKEMKAQLKEVAHYEKEILQLEVGESGKFNYFNQFIDDCIVKPSRLTWTFKIYRS